MPDDPYASYQDAKADPYSDYQSEPTKPEPGFFESAWGTAKDVAKGAVKGVLEGAQGLYHLENFGQEDVPEDFHPFPQGSKQAATFDKLAADQRQNNKQYSEMLKSRNTAQTVGKVGEAVVETALMPEFSGPGKFVSGSKLLSKAPKIIKTGAEIGTKAGLQGFVQGTAHSGSLVEGAKQGATASVAAPLIQGLATPTGKLLRKVGQKAYERFLIPGGGPLANKQIAKDGAEELIKRGEFALTKGGFTRKIEQHLMDSEAEVQRAEDEALERMGYGPTGRSSQEWTKYQEKNTPPGETWDVDPIGFNRNVPARRTGNATPASTRTNGFTQPEQGLTPHVPPEAPEQGLTSQRGRIEKAGQQPKGTPGEGPFYSTRYRSETIHETKQGLIDMRPVIQKLRASIQEGTLNGRTVPGYGAANGTRKLILKRLLEECNPNGTMDAQDVIFLRRRWDKLLDWTKPQPMSLKPGQKDAFMDAANFLRHEINEQVPGMREANSKYHFYSGINRVLKDKAEQQVGHRARGLIGTASIYAGALTGAYHQNPEEAIALAMLAGTVDAIVNSGANLTGSALALDRAGQALHNGKVQLALTRLATVGAGAVRNDSKQ